jgi:hypothetical protein
LIRSKAARSRNLLVLGVLFAAVSPNAAHAAPGWFSPTNVSDPSFNTFAGDFDVDGSGNATAVWLRTIGIRNRVQAAVRQPQSLTFGTAQTISPSGEDASDPRVAVNDSGEAVAVWTLSSTGVVQAAYRAAGAATFGAPVSISSSGSFNARIAMDQAGNAHAIWERQIGSNLVIESASKPPAGAFGPIETLSEPSFNSDDPHIAAEPGGMATALWTRFNGVSIVQGSVRRELNYPRPSGASPVTVALVPEFEECLSPGNANHVTPLDERSCSPPVPGSSLLTMATVGAGSGSVSYTAINGNPSTTTDEADVGINARITDVRCAAGGTPGCATAGDDYIGQVSVSSVVRQTDLANGIFEDDPGTVVDFELAFPINCVGTSSTAVGSTCALATTADTLVPNYVQERKRTLLSMHSIRVLDAGADGSLVPSSGTCPFTCGSGDEGVYLRQGVFTP